jgi:NTE family protein
MFSQSVGLVLSGGGAKGLSHLGVIKALEDNNIPIDYISGTSMGAIVGGMYAIGLSVDDMVYIIKSDRFLSCYKGNRRGIIPRFSIRQIIPLRWLMST